MRRHAWLVGILIGALAVAALVSGCGKKDESATGRAATRATAGGSANELGDLLGKREAVTSYVMVVDAAGQKSRMAFKMDGGKIVAMKIDSGPGGWVIMRMDKKIQYIYNPQTKTAMAMPISGSSESAPSGPPVPAVPDAAAIKALTDAKVTSETVDGVDCLKVAKADGSEAYWVEKEHGLPVQVLSSGKMTKIKYEQINSVPDSEFELPAGAKLQQMPKMPKMPNMPPNMPKMPNMPK